MEGMEFVETDEREREKGGGVEKEGGKGVCG